MAVKQSTTSGQHLVGTTTTWVWAGMANADTGSPVPCTDASGPWLATLLSGTLGAGGNVRWEGSVDGGTTWFTLNDDAGAPLNMTALNTNKLVKERPTMVRPNVTAGDGTTSLTAVLVLRR